MLRPTPERISTNPKLVARVRYAQGSVMPMIRQMNTHVTVPQTSLNGNHLSNRRGWNIMGLKGKGIECTISEITKNNITFNNNPPILVALEIPGSVCFYRFPVVNRLLLLSKPRHSASCSEQVKHHLRECITLKDLSCFIDSQRAFTEVYSDFHTVSHN